MGYGQRGARGYSRTDLPFVREAERLAREMKGMRLATQRARSKLAREIPVAWRRDIRDRYNLPMAQLRDRIEARVDGDSVLLSGRRRAIGLINYDGRWSGRKSKGATFKVLVGGTRSVHAGAFIATGRSGNRHIFRREDGASRLPIKAMYGPSAAGMVANRERQARMAVKTKDIYTREVERVRKSIRGR